MGQAEDNCQSLYNSDGEISVVRDADEVIEEEIVEDSDKEWMIIKGIVGA